MVYFFLSKQNIGGRFGNLIRIFEKSGDHCDDQKSPRAEPTEHGHTHSRGSPFSTLEGDIPTKWSTLLLVCMHIVCSGGVWSLR